MSDASVEASMGDVQGSNTLLVVPENATSDNLEDSWA